MPQPRTRSIAAEVHEITGANGAGDLLKALAGVVAEGDPTTPTAAVLNLVTVLNAGVKPDLLSEEILRETEILSFFKYQRDPSHWQFGTFAWRRKLEEFLYSQAKVGGAHAREFARAALIFVANDGMMTAVPMLSRLLRDPDFDRLSGWSSAQLAAIRSLASDEEARMRQFGQELLAAAEPLQAIIDAPEAPIDRSNFQKALAALDRLAALAPYRPEMQTRLANLAWRLVNVARAAGDDDALNIISGRVQAWKATGEPHFSRWLDEALSEAPRPQTVGFSVISSKILQGKIQSVNHSDPTT